MRRLTVDIFGRRSRQSIAVGVLLKASSSAYTRDYGLTLHRRGGVSVVGIPRAGGTTLAWGRSLNEFMQAAGAKPAAELADVAFYFGRDF